MREFPLLSPLLASHLFKPREFDQESGTLSRSYEKATVSALGVTWGRD